MALGLTPQQIIEKNTHPLLRINNRWSRVKLKNLAEVQNGFAFSSKYFNHTNGIPLIRIRDIDRPVTENLYSGEFQESYIVYHNDILIGMDGDFNVSKWPGKKGLLNQRVCRLNFFSEYYEKKFLYLCLQPYLNAINEETSAVTVKHLSSRTLNDIPLPLPPLPEQRAIVAKIEKLFSDVDNGITNLKEAKAKLGIYRQAVLKKAFEGELTKEWREEKGYSFQTWKLIKLGKIAEIKRGKSKHRPRNDSKLFGGKYPFIQTGDVKAACGGKILKYTQTYNEIGLAQSQLWPAGTLCLTIAANIADTAFLGLDACFPDSVVGIKSEDNILSLKYLNYLIQKLKVEIDSKASATAQKNINVEFLNKLEIPITTIEEQNVIVEAIESRFSVCDKLVESIDQGLEQAEALRQSILKKAFSGELLSEDELESCRREPDWEPADKLLERIKKERITNR